MKVSFHLVKHAEHQRLWGAALRRGMERHGIKTTAGRYDSVSNCDLAVVWTWRQLRLIKEMWDSGRHVLVMERGHLQPRREWLSLGFDGLAGRGLYARPADNGERFEQHYGAMLKPWGHQGGSHLLLVGQVPGDAALHGLDMEKWAQQVTDDALSRGYSVIYRPHPKVIMRDRFCPVGALYSPRPLEVDLAEALSVVTWSSTTAVEAVLAGIPVVAMDEGSMAWPIAGHNLDQLDRRHDRFEWCNEMAWKQWSLEEVESGVAWDHLRSVIQ